MKFPELSLRVRIFLFFAFLMVASVVIITSAIYTAHLSTPDRLPRLLATYTGVAALVIVLVLLLVWQLFDRYVAAALQSLARQMQTALHIDNGVGGWRLEEKNSFQYLGPVSEAADELIQAYHALKNEQGRGTTCNMTHAAQAQQLAVILRDLSMGVLIMNHRHEILLYNQVAFTTINSPDSVGLARDAMQLFDGPELLSCVTRLFERANSTSSEKNLKIILRLANDKRSVTARIGPIVNDDKRVSGYSLLLEDPAKTTSSLSVSHQADAVSSKVEPFSLRVSRPEFYDVDLFNRPLSVNLESRPLRSLDYVVFDTETTGLNPSGGDQIVSIAAVRIVNGRVLSGECFDNLICPGIPVPARSTAIHGITDQMLKGMPGIDKILPKFAAFIGDSILVAHNAAFDMKFLELQSDRCQVKLTNPVLDTVLLSAYVHDHSARHTLDVLAARYGIHIEGRHTALGDALATAHVFVKLVGQLSCRNINSLSEATIASNKIKRIIRQQKAY